MNESADHLIVSNPELSKEIRMMKNAGIIDYDRAIIQTVSEETI